MAQELSESLEIFKWSMLEHTHPGHIYWNFLKQEKLVKNYKTKLVLPVLMCERHYRRKGRMFNS